MNDEELKEMADFEDQATKGIAGPMAINPSMLANTTKDNLNAAAPAIGSVMGGPFSISSSHAHAIFTGMDWGKVTLPRHQLASELFLLLLEFDLEADQEKFLAKISDLVDGDNLKALAIYQRLKSLAKGFTS